VVLVKHPCRQRRFTMSVMSDPRLDKTGGLRQGLLNDLLRTRSDKTVDRDGFIAVKVDPPDGVRVRVYLRGEVIYESE
jgi:hypothetical protein